MWITCSGLDVGILFHLNWVAVKWHSLSWLRPIRHIRATSDDPGDMAKTDRHPVNLFWMVAATANWVASRPLRVHMKWWDEVRWGEIRDVNTPLRRQYWTIFVTKTTKCKQGNRRTQTLSPPPVRKPRRVHVLADICRRAKFVGIDVEV